MQTVNGNTNDEKQLEFIAKLNQDIIWAYDGNIFCIVINQMAENEENQLVFMYPHKNSLMYVGICIVHVRSAACLCWETPLIPYGVTGCSCLFLHPIFMSGPLLAMATC